MGTTSVGAKLKATGFIRLACGLNWKRTKEGTALALSAHPSGMFGSPSAYACAGLPEGMCPLSSSKRLVSAGDKISQSAKPQAQTETGNGEGSVPERGQQGAVDGKDAEPVL